MNDEIKKILNYLELYKNLEEGLLSAKDKKMLLDYITNLQQENERLKSELECYENGVYFSSKVDELERENERLKDQNINEILKKDLEICAKQYKKSDEKLEKYKSRIEKAVKYIKEDMYSEPNELYGLIDGEHLLNILNGRSDE